jgi:hypothetical protein
MPLAHVCHSLPVRHGDRATTSVVWGQRWVNVYIYIRLALALTRAVPRRKPRRRGDQPRRGTPTWVFEDAEHE